MERARTLTGFASIGAGAWHLIDLLLFPQGMLVTTIILIAFAAAFFVFGYLLLRASISPWVVAVIAILGALVAISGMVTAFNAQQVIFILFDLAILAGCGYLLFRRPARRAI